ncbi:HTH_Tnp_Tc3_2 domain-containing protein [Trichonephila clavipes]|nr:HTH_Tnp_Tc3_2 domain-containing protein [Trichonephila clavipes]
MGLRSKRPIRVPLLTKCHRQLRVRWAREHRDWSMDQWERVAWSEESRFVIHPADDRIRIRRLPVATSMYSRSYTGRWWQYYALGDVLLGVPETRGCRRADHECYRVSEHHCGPVAPLHGLCFSSWKWNVPTGQRSVSQG